MFDAKIGRDVDSLVERNGQAVTRVIESDWRTLDELERGPALRCAASCEWLRGNRVQSGDPRQIELGSQVHTSCEAVT